MSEAIRRKIAATQRARGGEAESAAEGDRIARVLRAKEKESGRLLPLSFFNRDRRQILPDSAPAGFKILIEEFFQLLWRDGLVEGMCRHRTLLSEP